MTLLNFANKVFVPGTIITILAIGCSQSNPSQSTTQEVQKPLEIENKSAQSDLPAWLEKKPEDWGDSVWKDYQATLIKLRAPIANTHEYSDDDLRICTAEVEHFPGDYEDYIKREWEEKWKAKLTRFERTGGCGCCNEIYTVTGPIAAIEEFPVAPGRREYYPNFDVEVD